MIFAAVKSDAEPFGHAAAQAGDERDWGAPTGYLSLMLLKSIVPDFAQREIFCCGPEPYMAAVRTMLKEADFDMAHYHEESFSFERHAPSVEGAATKPPPPDALEHEYPIAAVYRNTARQPLGPWAGRHSSAVLAGVDVDEVEQRSQNILHAGQVLGTCASPGARMWRRSRLVPGPPLPAVLPQCARCPIQIR